MHRQHNRYSRGRNTAGGAYRRGCLVPLILLPLGTLALVLLT